MSFMSLTSLMSSELLITNIFHSLINYFLIFAILLMIEMGASPHERGEQNNACHTFNLLIFSWAEFIMFLCLFAKHINIVYRKSLN